MLLIIASLGVITLGYYAFIMASDTMTLPFVGQSKQTGSHWMFPVALPNRLSDITDQGPILDGSTIQEVLTVNGKPLNEAQKDALVFEGKDDFFNLRPRGDIFKEEDVFRVSSREYNEKKKTGYKLPNDIEFVYRSEVPRGLVIQEVGDPKEKTFSVEIYGFHGLSAKDIRWYAFTSLDQNAPCGGEAPLWNARRMRPISTRVIQSTLHGPREKAIVSVDVDTTQPRQCVIAGLQGEVFFHLNRSLSPFSLS